MRGNLLKLEATGILIQDADPGGTTLVYACNGFNELIRIAMLWTIWNCWLSGARFTFN